jgi:hypothetical protein
MVHSSNPAYPGNGNGHNRFAPERFSIGLSDSDLSGESIPIDRIITGRRRITGRFSTVPLAAVRLFPPTARVLLMLAYVRRFQSPDIEGGWYKLKTGISTDFHLHDKDIRRRAITALEKTGVIEVMRHDGKSPHIRLFPTHVSAFEDAPPLKRLHERIICAARDADAFVTAKARA